MTIKCFKWLQEGMAVRRKEWPAEAFIILIKKNDETFILSYWPQHKDKFVFFPSRQLPHIIKAECNWPDTYECIADQIQTRIFLQSYIPGITFFNELTAINRANTYFRQNRYEISRKSTKRFVVISEDEVIGEYDDPVDGALQTLALGFELGQFIVQDLSVDTAIYHSQVDSYEN